MLKESSRQEPVLCPFLFNILTRHPSQCNKASKENKRHPDWKRTMYNYFFSDGMIIQIREWQTATDFCKVVSFMGTPSHPFTYVLSMAAFPDNGEKLRNCQSIWLRSLKYILYGLLRKSLLTPDLCRNSDKIHDKTMRTWGIAEYKNNMQNQLYFYILANL